MDFVDQVFSLVEKNFKPLMADNYNPIPLAIDMLLNPQQSRAREIQEMYERMEDVMDIIVNEYHFGFHNSIQSYSVRINPNHRVRLQLNQGKICLTRNSYENLYSMWQKSLQNNQILSILEKIERLNKFPDRIRNELSKRDFLVAVNLYQKGIKELNDEEYKTLDILKTLKVNMNSLGYTIFEELTTELNMSVLGEKIPECDGNVDEKCRGYLLCLLECFSILDKSNDLDRKMNDFFNVTLKNFTESMISKGFNKVGNLQSEGDESTSNLFNFFTSVFTKFQMIIQNLKIVVEFIGCKVDNPMTTISYVWINIQDQVVDDSTNVFNRLEEKIIKGNSCRTKKTFFSIKQIDFDRKSNVNKLENRIIAKFNNIPIVYSLIKKFILSIHMIIVIEDDGDDFNKLETFLDEIVLDSYCPFLTESMNHELNAILQGSDAFLVKVDSPPFFNCILPFLKIIHRLNGLICQVDVLKDSATALICNAIENLVESFIDKYKSIVSHDLTVNTEDGNEVFIVFSGNLASLYNNQDDENQFLFQNKGNRTLHKSEILTDYNKLKFIAHLYKNLNWIANQFQKCLTLASPTFLDPINSEDSINLKLPISENLQESIKRTENISSKYLCTLKFELKCHILYFCDLSFKQGSYHLDEPASEPDINIKHLIKSVESFQESIYSCLENDEIKFIHTDLDSLIATIFINNIVCIKRMNFYGVEKMMKNLNALTHSLNRFIHCPVSQIEKAKSFYSLFSLFPEEIIAFTKSNCKYFSLGDFTNMINLIYNDIVCSKENPRKREYLHLISSIQE
ncbi:hypothetical protein ROZALSC1DRAFT_28888, partial [Rozella allomycis CSF55]